MIIAIGVEMERKGIVIFLVAVVCVVGLRAVEANGAPRVRLSSILDADGEWHVHAGNGFRNGGVYGTTQDSGIQEKENPEDVKIWPMPVSVARGESTLLVPRTFKFEVAEGLAVSDTLTQAFVRYYDLIFSQHAAHPVRYNLAPTPSRTLSKLVVTLGSRNEEVK